MKFLVLQKELLFSQKGQEQLKETFKVISQEALEKLQEKAKGDLDERQATLSELMRPVKETLSKLDAGLLSLEKERKVDHTLLSTKVEALSEAKKDLTTEMAKLVRALRTPIVRGRWGEIQLRRVVEIAGMLKQCDFFEQSSSETKEGIFRPDLIVHLPGGRQVIIDAKVPLEAYLDAASLTEEALRVVKLKEHARLVRAHVGSLSKKTYHQHFSPTPEFVVLFLPSEPFFSAALEYDPSLIEIGAEQGVIIATPTTLIALLRAVAYGWKQENLSLHAEKVSQLGHELYKRIVDMSIHFSKMGRSLSSAVEAYNKGIGSLETRVLVSARKFQELGAGASHLELEPIEKVESHPRPP